MPPVRRGVGDPPPLYGSLEELFSVEIRHGGIFVGEGVNKKYVNSRIDYFDNCETETWSILWIKDFIGQLGHDQINAQVYWLLPGKRLHDGLRIVDRDVDTISMSSVVPKMQHFILYVDHNDMYNDLDLDDICIVGSPTLPPVMHSPKKPSMNMVGKNTSPRMKTKAAKGKLQQSSGVSNVAEVQQGSQQVKKSGRHVVADEVYIEDSDDSASDWCDSDNDVAQDDDDLYEEFVDGLDDDPTERNKKKVYEADSDYDSEDLDVPYSDNDAIESESEEEQEDEESKKKKKKKKKVVLRRFKPEDMNCVNFQIGMVFPTVVDLRNAIQQYIIQRRVGISYVKNDKQRVRAKCEEDCPWYIFAAPDTRTNSWIVKKFVGNHTCERQWELKAFTAKYLAAQYLENFRTDDKMSIKNFARIVQEDFNMTPSRSKLERSRRIAMRQIFGDEVKQYNMLWDYSEEIRRSNPGSSMYMTLKDGNFSRLYMSLDACKRGFLAACRPIICLDGCHLKTKFGGQLLTAVGVDPNDCIYPIAIAVVEVEDTQTWKWFLKTLKEDLGIDNTTPWTLMSDRQKGLINAVNALFPHAAHRFCVRHLYQNFVKHWKGEHLKNKLWQIARSSHMAEWSRNMEEMKVLNQEAYNYLEAIDPSYWCKAFFNEYPKCDLLLNNHSEVFNKYILDAREMPILSMLHKIKNQLTARFYGKMKETLEWAGTICPKIRKKLDKNTEMSNNCFASPSGKGIFSVQGLIGQYTVNIDKYECSCRQWQLTGIPCRHAISCLRHERIKPESRVSACYSIDAFKIAYAEVIMPCRDQREWQNMNGIEVKPPVYEKKVGRPSKKRKKNPLEERDGTRMSRHGIIGHCSVCNSTSHNKRKCPELGRGPERQDDEPDAPQGNEHAAPLVHEHAAPQGNEHAAPLVHEHAEPQHSCNPVPMQRKLPVRRCSNANNQSTASTSVVSSLDSSITSNQVSQQNMSVMDVLMSQVVETQQSQAPLPLPESNFISSSRDALPEPRATTSTHGLAGQKKKKNAKCKKQSKEE